MTRHNPGVGILVRKPNTADCRRQGNWVFAGSARAARRQAAAMNLIQSAKLNGHDLYAYLKDILPRVPAQPASRLDDLLPHLWQPQL
jgi:transposase